MINRVRAWAILALLIILTVAASQAAFAAAGYRHVALPDYFAAMALNNRGEVVGFVFDESSQTSAACVATVKRGRVNLQFIAGADILVGTSPNGGYYLGLVFFPEQYGQNVVINSTTGTVTTFDPDVYVTAVNDSGTITGSLAITEANGDTEYPVFRQTADDTRTVLDNEYGYPVDVTSTGAVLIDDFNFFSGTSHVLVWNADGTTTSVAGLDYGAAISQAGTVVGSNGNVAGIWNGGNARALSRHQRTVATDVNDMDVALVNDYSATLPRALLVGNGRVRDLQTLAPVPFSWRVVSGIGINNSGDVLVYEANTFNGHTRGALLTH